MKESQIIVKNNQAAEEHRSERVKVGYQDERIRLEATEVELSRSKIMMIDADGNFVRVPFLLEH